MSVLERLLGDRLSKSLARPPHEKPPPPPAPPRPYNTSETTARYRRALENIAENSGRFTAQQLSEYARVILGGPQ